MKNIFYLVFFINIIVEPLYAFNYISTAFSTGSGGGYTAFKNTPESFKYNPSTISQITNTKIQIFFNSYFNGSEQPEENVEGYYAPRIYSYGFTVISPVRKAGGTGLGIYLLSTPFYTLTIISAGISSPLFKILNKKSGAGIKVNYLSKEFKIDDYTSGFFSNYSSSINGLSLDCGIWFDVGKSITTALSINNLISSDMGILTSEPIPPVYRLGLVYKTHFGKLFDKNIIISDLEYEENMNIHIGIKNYFFKEKLSINTGINLNYFSFGITGKYNINLITLNAGYSLNYYIKGFEGTIVNHNIVMRVDF